MRVLIVAGGFAPEVSATGPYNTDFARYLLECGHDVLVVTHVPHYPQWKRFEGYRPTGSLASVDGATIRRVPSYIPRRPTAARRIAYDTTFSASALIGSLRFRRQRPDVVFGVCSPLQVGLTCAALGRVWNVPFVFHLQDLLPDSATEVGMLTSPRSVRAAHKLGRLVYDRADAVTVIGDRFRDILVERGVPRDKVHVFPNWIDVNVDDPPPFRVDEVRAELGVREGGTLVMYVGNIGFKQGMSALVDAAAALAGEPAFRVAMVGDGADMPNVEAAVRRRADANVVLTGVRPRESLSELLTAADVLVVHQRKDVRDMVVPSKLLTYAAAGRPVVFAGAADSVGAKFVQDSGGGVVVAPEDPVALADGIRILASDAERRAQHGADARRYVRDRFDRSVVLERAERLLREVAQ